MAYPVWVTPTGDLGVIPENQYINIQLDAQDMGAGPLTYSFIAGEFPPGVYVDAYGKVQGVPIVTNAVVSTTNRVYKFTLRATNVNDEIADRTFSLTVTNIIPPRITPRTTYLGTHFDGNFLSIQLAATKVNPNAALTWTLESGNLPEGVTLSSNGLISGFVYPLPKLSDTYTWIDTTGNIGISGLGYTTGYSSTAYNQFAYDNPATYRNSSYQFNIKVFDGANYDNLSYRLNIAAKGSVKADDTSDTADQAELTIDTDNIYVPIVTTPPRQLPDARVNTNYAFKFDAIDPVQDVILFSLNASTADTFDENTFDTASFDGETQGLPTGNASTLALDTTTGWLYGNVGNIGNADRQTYTFSIGAYKRDQTQYTSIPITYTWTVLGDISNTIDWITSPNLGLLDNGTISELAVVAKSNAGKDITYSVVSPSALPQGLSMNSSGLIYGRCTFEYFSVDGDGVIIDGDTTTFDNTYNVTVKATTTDGTATATRTFSIRINNFNLYPYENLYLRALPEVDQRETFLSIVNNTELFPDDSIYRIDDPWFGRAKEIRSLFLAGVAPHQMTDYISAMITNHYNKKINFSNVKTARALDSNFDTTYEVVYIELEETNVDNGKSPANSITLHNQNYYKNNSLFDTLYPNSFANMSSKLDMLGYTNRGALPAWMTSTQADTRVLGFTRAIVLAYTKPGRSEQIAYRLRSNNIVFNSIDFVSDRYLLDNHLSTNYNITTGKFISGVETTFDRILRPGYVTTVVDYAVRDIAFQDINGQTVHHVSLLGGLDGITNLQDNQTLIFAQQEFYQNSFRDAVENDGWNIITESGYTIIPGYYDHVYNPAIENQRAGVWKMNITIIDPLVDSADTTNQLISLSFVNTVALGEYVQINYGARYGYKVLYYDLSIKIGYTVPEYSILNISSLNVNRTRFDSFDTKFINNRDTKANPGINDKTLKFPRFNVFQ